MAGKDGSISLPKPSPFAKYPKFYINIHFEDTLNDFAPHPSYI